MQIKNSIIDEIDTFKKDMRRKEYVETPWTIAIQDKIRFMKSNNVRVNNNIEELLYIFEKIINDPYVVSTVISVEYITTIAGFAGNTAIGFDFLPYIERAISSHTQIGRPLSDLYIAKFRCLTLVRVESIGQLEVLKEAKKSARSKEELVRVLNELAYYYNLSSLYEDAIQTCQECLDIIDTEMILYRYKARVFSTLGMVYFTRFDYEKSEKYLHKAYDENKIHVDNQNVATILHYLGRIYEAKGILQNSMNYYVEGHQFQELCPEEPGATAFYHLRLGELLIGSNLSKEAKYHLIKSQELFLLVKDNSSGQTQINLSLAMLYEKDGNYIEAESMMYEALRFARSRNFHRGELLCLVKLFWLHFKYKKFIKAGSNFIAAMYTWFNNGEMARNGGANLLILYVLQILSTPFKVLLNKPHTVVGAASFSEGINFCSCPVHHRQD